MKSEKGVTLVSLLIYIAVLLTVMVVIGSISAMFNKNLDSVASENDAATAFSMVDACILTETKKKDNTVVKLGGMTGNTEGAFYFSENDAAPYTAIQFSTQNQICYIGDSIYFNKAKICDGVSSFFIDYNQAVSADQANSLSVSMQIGKKNYNHTYTFR